MAVGAHAEMDQIDRPRSANQRVVRVGRLGKLEVGVHAMYSARHYVVEQDTARLTFVRLG